MLAGRRILLVVGGGIAAYKSLELVRLLRKADAEVVPVLTAAGAEFVTPLSLAALAGHKVFSELFDLTDEEYRALADFLLFTGTINTQNWPPNDAG